MKKPWLNEINRKARRRGLDWEEVVEALVRHVYDPLFPTTWEDDVQAALDETAGDPAGEPGLQHRAGAARRTRKP
jgi:hypothetical protein